MTLLEQETLPAALAGTLTDEQRQAVIETPREKRLEVLARALAQPEGEVLAKLAAAAGLTKASNLETDPEARGLLPARLVHEYQIIPIQFRTTEGEPRQADNRAASDGPASDLPPLHLATAWLPDETMTDWLRTFTPRPLVWHLAVPERVHQLIIENFGVGSGSLEDGDDGYVAPEAQKESEEIVDEEAAVVRFVTDVISQAIEDQATDIHFEPQEGQLRIRYRVDGLLVPVPVPENLLRFQDAIISRLKIMARMNISEKRLPQDGRISLRIGTRAVDVRVSTLPSAHGERAVLRLLDKTGSKLSLEAVGMEGNTLRRFEHLVAQPHGIILVTGPTGSGKTTTLYAALSRLDAHSSNIMTVEDPIEYYIDGIGQTQVNTRVDMSFARGLRAILRQDPDIVMVGEIRDLETAQIAVQASLTGHLVLSTLHTNTAVGAVTRLRDMGVEPFLLASSLIGVVAQRLVRTLDPALREPFTAGELERRQLGIEPEAAPMTLWHAGADGKGYRGRTGIYELVPVDDAMRTLIHDGASEAQLERHARGLTPSIRDDGLGKVRRGTTTLEEVLRVTRED